MAEKIIDDQSDGIEKGFHILDISIFNGEDDRVFFYLKKDSIHNTANSLAAVDIWNYKDASLQSAQLHNLQRKLFYQAALNIRDRKVIKLEYDREK